MVLRRCGAVLALAAAAVCLCGCPQPADDGKTGAEKSDSPSDDKQGGEGKNLSGRPKGMQEARAAVAAGTLTLKEYPPLPYPPGHNEYVKLLMDRCGVNYVVPSVPPGVAEAEFIQEVRGWNEVMEAEIQRKFGADILGRLQEEGRKLWREQLPSPGKGPSPPNGDE